MLFKLIFIIILAAFAVIMGAAAIIYTGFDQNDDAVGDKDGTTAAGTSTDTEEEELQLVPDITVVDRSGSSVKLSDMRGKPVILNFWASWCGPCKSEMPDFEEAYKKYSSEITFMMINLTDGSSETVESASDFIDGEGYTFPIYFDTEQTASSAYGITSIP